MAKLKQANFVYATFVGPRAWAQEQESEPINLLCSALVKCHGQEQWPRALVKIHGQELWPRASFCQTLIWNPLEALTSLPLKEVGGRGGSL